MLPRLESTLNPVGLIFFTVIYACMIADFLANLGNDSLLADSLAIPGQNPMIDYVVPLNILCILEFIRFARSKTNRLIFFA